MWEGSQIGNLSSNEEKGKAYVSEGKQKVVEATKTLARNALKTHMYKQEVCAMRFLH